MSALDIIFISVKNILGILYKLQDKLLYYLYNIVYKEI